MIDNRYRFEAFLYSSEQPAENQFNELLSFLKAKYSKDITLSWVEDKAVKTGFRLEVTIVDADDETGLSRRLETVYDWTVEGRLQQLRDELTRVAAPFETIIPLMKETIKSWTPKALEEEVGTVLTVGDGIATVSGLHNATYQEILLFSNGVRGMVLELKRDEIGCILFDDGDTVTEGSTVKRTGTPPGSVGDGFLGRGRRSGQSD